MLLTLCRVDWMYLHFRLVWIHICKYETYTQFSQFSMDFGNTFMADYYVNRIYIEFFIDLQINLIVC